MINLLIDEWRQKSFDKHPCRIDEMVSSASFSVFEMKVNHLRRLMYSPIIP